MSTAATRRARDRDKELRYRELAEAMIEKFGPNARREIEFGRRDQLKRTRGDRRMQGKLSGRGPNAGLRPL